MCADADRSLVYIADLWERNQEFLKQHLGYSDSDRFGANWVLMPETPLAKFNHAGCIRVPHDSVDGFIAECQEFYRAQGLPYAGFLVTPATEPPDLGEILSRRGCHSEPNPVMLWVGRELPRFDPAIRVELTRADQEELLFFMLRQVFFPNATPQSLAMGRRAVQISYGLGGLNYIAYRGDRPVGTGMLFVHGTMGGIYNMATLPQYRGRGVATAILAACLLDAIRLGCTHMGLTPTPMGRPLYERLGFREIYQERYYSSFVY